MTDRSPPKPTVFVVDDDADLRHSLDVLITALGHRVLTFSSAVQFRNFYKSRLPGCLLLDIRMPRQSGLELYEDLLQNGNGLPVIFITAHADVRTAVAAMKTGAIEFLEKPFERDVLQDRIEKALALDAEWRSQEAKLSAMETKIGSLTSRERDTLEMIVEGLPNKVMASRQDVTERAIEMRRARIMQKLGVRTVPELLDLTITHRVMCEVRRLQGERILFR